jgi:hypothetical protein
VKIISRKVLLSALGALGASMFLASPAAAQPSPKPAAADVRFVYDAPQISTDGGHVTWRWTLTNNGPGTAGNVVLVHTLTQPLKITKLAQECKETKSGISCSYGSIDDGEKKEGSLDAELTPDVSGTVEINGRVTWRQGSAKPENSYTETVPIESAPAQAPVEAADQ